MAKHRVRRLAFAFVLLLGCGDDEMRFVSTSSDPDDAGRDVTSHEAGVGHDVGDPDGGSLADSGGAASDAADEMPSADAAGDADAGIGAMRADPCTDDCFDLTWVPIEGGVFQMGSSYMDPDHPGVDDVNRPVHQVTVSSFEILRTEVTQDQYAEFVESTGAADEPDPRDPPPALHHPTRNMGWDKAREFCEWIGGRLPTEAEWEYAARSRGRDIIRPWGDEPADCTRTVIRDVTAGDAGRGCGTDDAWDVCSKQLGNTDQGLCDMLGNVSEWVEDDWHQTYDGAPADGSAWVDDPRADERVARGANFLASVSFAWRIAHRSTAFLQGGEHLIGIRCVR